MCGIVGALSSAPIDAELVARMRDRLVHRGPDDEGLWRSDDAHVCLGFRRLAIVDLSPEANQPFHSHDGRFVIIVNGEIYNFRALRDELRARGVSFRTQSDTEVLLESFRCWGERCLDKLSGMFALAIWDAQEKRLFCARDRAGEKPFYYATVDGSFVFGSELKALLPWPGFRREIHYPAMVDFLTFGFVADPKSIWEGCFKLPPGHWMTVEMRPGEPPRAQAPRAYWDLEFDPDTSVRDWTPRILGALQGASLEMSYADVPVGTFLSGGVDSSSVTASLVKAGCRVTAFTVGFEEPEFDERPWAREVAEQYGVEHLERVVVPEDVAAVFETLLWHYDEPFNDYSYLPTYYLCREARRMITVALSGDGGDEMFAGYTKYRRLGLMNVVRPMIPRPLGRLLAAGAEAVFSDADPRYRTAVQYGSDAPAMLADMLNVGFTLPALRRAARGPLAETLRHYAPVDVVKDLLRRAPPERIGLVNAMRYLDLKLTLAGDILVKVDRASMAVSLEVRPVYLHRDMMELAARIPPDQLADRGGTKKALKTALRTWLPEPLLHRRKQGFAMPLGKWIDSGPLTRGAEGSQLNELLDARLLTTLLRTHGRGSSDTVARTHSLLFLEHWLPRWSGLGSRGTVNSTTN